MSRSGSDSDPQHDKNARGDTAELRAETADRFATGTDTRVERYWALMGVINRWPPFPAMPPAFGWTIEALRAHPRPA